MNKNIALIFITLLVVTGCVSPQNHRKISEQDIPDYHTKISDRPTGEYRSVWIQPTNKKEKCEFLMEGYNGDSGANNNPPMQWDGGCENGKAQGLGKITFNHGAFDTYEITYHNAGITDQLFYQTKTNTVEFGAYVRENNQMTKRFINAATINSNQELGSIYLSVEQDLNTMISKGVKRQNNNQSRTGIFGNKFFFGTAEGHNERVQWLGFVNLTTAGFESYGVAKSSQKTKYVKFNNGSEPEIVNKLPESYINSITKITEEALKSAQMAQNAGQLAIAMKKKYDAQKTQNNPESKSDNIKPKSSHDIYTGTGFFISNDGYLLTNNHVIANSSMVSIISNGKKITADIVAQDQSNDIALLKVKKQTRGLPIEFKNKTKQGSEIAILGYPNIGMQGNEQKATFGYINANSGIRGDTRYFQISAPIQPGNSGSPLFNEYGVVIGIVSATLNQSTVIEATGTLAQNVNYAINITYALPMLITHNVDYQESKNNRTISKTSLIESITDGVILVVAE